MDDSTVTAIQTHHLKEIKKINADKDRVPLIQQQIETLKTELAAIEQKKYIERSKEEIKRVFQIQDEIARLNEQIVKFKEQPDKYFLKNGELILDYLECQNTKTKTGVPIEIQKVEIDEFLAKPKIKMKNDHIVTKANCLHKFLANIDPTYLYLKEHTITEENFCHACQRFRVVKQHEAKSLCEGCGIELAIITDTDKPSVKDPPPEIRYYEYKRFGHFCDWLLNLQGKESTEVPENVINCVLLDLKKRRVSDLSKLTDKDIRDILRRHEYYKYYERSTQILFKINRIPPIQITAAMEKNLQSLFLLIQEPYELFRPKNRSNMGSYAYFIFKFCQLLDSGEPNDPYREFSEKLKLLKGKDKLYELDKIWKKICKYMGGKEKGWIFIPSY